ncbi:MAG: patatin-like phospholipase family protein [Alphaproteobacteria bacterium]
MDHGWRALARRCAITVPLLLLASCAGDLNSQPVNVPGESVSEFTLPPLTTDSPALDQTIVSLSFSGGGMRASAFSYGVLDAMHETALPGSDKHLTDAVDVVTGVSGGSVTAAYYALEGDATFPRFRTDFLDQNAESGLSTDVSLGNVMRLLTFGGVNDNSQFPVWLNQHLFHDATYRDVMEKRRPILWISASDIINRTPFVFAGVTFRPLCSDLSKLKLADAVAASAAVPGAFTPINVESFGDQCDWKAKIAVSNDAMGDYYGLQTVTKALANYRDPKVQKYVKLLDGGLTDNFGVQGLVAARLLQKEPYAPLHPDRAIRLKQALFLVVNSGRGPVRSKLGIQLAPPGAIELAGMVTDTAIDSNVHSTYDLFRIVITDWQKELVKWRCSLPKERVQAALGPGYGAWKCDDVHFYVTQISFADTDAATEAKLNAIPTRFVLKPEEIDSC